MCLASWQPGPDGQYRLSSTERLNLNLLVNTENNRIGWRVQIQADNIVDFPFRLRIGVELKRFNPVWFESMSLPDAMNRAVRQSTFVDRSRELQWLMPDVGGFRVIATTWAVLREVTSRGPAAPRLLLQSVQSSFGEPATNTTDLNRRIAGQQRHLGSGNIVCHEQYGPSPATQASCARRRPHNPFKFDAIIFRQND
jgi:hypothetical protein